MVRETRHLWVGNLPGNIREDKIKEYFKRQYAFRFILILIFLSLSQPILLLASLFFALMTSMLTCVPPCLFLIWDDYLIQPLLSNVVQMLSRSGGSAVQVTLCMYIQRFIILVLSRSSVCACVGYAGLLKLQKYVYYTKYLSVDTAL